MTPNKLRNATTLVRIKRFTAVGGGKEHTMMTTIRYYLPEWEFYWTRLCFPIADCSRRHRSAARIEATLFE